METKARGRALGCGQVVIHSSTVRQASYVYGARLTLYAVTLDKEHSTGQLEILVFEAADAHYIGRSYQSALSVRALNTEVIHAAKELSTGRQRPISVIHGTSREDYALKKNVVIFCLICPAACRCQTRAYGQLGLCFPPRSLTRPFNRQDLCLLCKTRRCTINRHQFIH